MYDIFLVQKTNAFEGFIDDFVDELGLYSGKELHQDPVRRLRCN